MTHAFGGNKLRVEDMLRKAGGPSLPLVAAMRGVEDKLPLWAYDDGCDFIRGTRLLNVTLKPKDIAISSIATSCLFSHLAPPGCSHMFHLHNGLPPIRESCTDFHFPSTDDDLTGPGYMNQLA